MRAKEEMAESYLKLLGKDTETGASFIDKLFADPVISREDFGKFGRCADCLQNYEPKDKDEVTEE